MDDDLRRARLTEARVGRLATVGSDRRPHVVPCCFAVDGDRLFTAVDDIKAKSTMALRRLDNIATHPHASLLVDHYDDVDWSALWWVRFDGTARVATVGSTEGIAGIERLMHKYEQYRRQPPPGPVILIELERWSAWP